MNDKMMLFIFLSALFCAIIVRGEDAAKCETPSIVNCDECAKPVGQNSSSGVQAKSVCQPPKPKQSYYNSTAKECHEVITGQCFNQDVKLFPSIETCNKQCSNTTVITSETNRNSGNTTDSGVRRKRRYSNQLFDAGLFHVVGGSDGVSQGKSREEKHKGVQLGDLVQVTL